MALEHTTKTGNSNSFTKFDDSILRERGIIKTLIQILIIPFIVQQIGVLIAVIGTAFFAAVHLNDWNLFLFCPPGVAVFRGTAWSWFLLVDQEPPDRDGGGEAAIVAPR